MMNQNIRKMINEKFTKNEDRAIIIQLVELASYSPSDVKKKVEEIIDNMSVEITEGDVDINWWITYDWQDHT